MRHDLGWLGTTLALAAAVAGIGCRCGSGVPGRVGKAVTALDAVPSDVDAVIVINVEGLRQGSLGQFVYTPWVVKLLEEWGGAPCGALAVRAARTAAFGIRLAHDGERAKEFFFSVEGATLDEVKACIDEHAKRQGLSSSYEEIAGVRGLTDSRGLHILAGGERVIARSFPFNDTPVLNQLAKVVAGETPSLSSNAPLRELVAQLGGDVTVALSETRDLFATYGRDLEDAVAAMVPPDMCATPIEVGLFLAMARTQGFGALAGLQRVIDGKFKDLEKICLTDAVRETFRSIAMVRAAGVTVTGRADVELGLLLVFDDPGPAEELRGVLSDLLEVLAVLPERLDVLERDWPMIVGWIQKKIDLPTLRETLRNPVFKHLTVGGEGATVELRIRIEEADVRTAVESTQRTLTKLVAKE